ncbi:dihydroorotate dehydrogenase-like protein [Methylococcus capsulatus]|jgi:dihydroorotate dehydrogenase (fumarate)|uniref:Dihydroorotate dehydrogenase (Fumarate) n=1 Tax=Methylococcus capsulatus TaxID=414 RepID=A0AA35V350_METCP|nr:dihydroorotate dehydrogenase-like protein [Methylococcus capsulatus]QXP90194.1 dihydroorotate dehydrogenase-like protein [Methylococcus capsulatus]CAI8747456.1 dihydroorotate dehydrogenase (fumarate) [Methylococcus capsulatus]
MDLSTNYMGLSLKHPVVASASPLSESLHGIRRLEDGGVAAVVLFSLFEEQIQQENEVFSRLLTAGSESFAESLSYFPATTAHHAGPDRYLELIRRAVEAVDIPVIASLNCVSDEGWIDYARQIEQAGAHGLELNIYGIETDPTISGGEIEQRYVNSLTAVKSAVHIPVALKLSPYFSAMAHMAVRLERAGADALVLFNRFYQPDVDVERLDLHPSLELSSPSEIRLPLLWIALLHGKLRLSLGATTGVAGAGEVVKYLLAGADAVMTASALLRHGPSYAAVLVKGLEHWMDAHGFASVTLLKGIMGHDRIANPAAYERANYLKVLDSYQMPPV